ncbi:MAG: hypothetical protein QOJ66_3670 [Ilumatobacteraceae bacterium]
MSELMEREPLDDVARRAVAALRRDASTRSLPELSLRSPRRWIAPVVALAALAVVVVGLIAIGTNRNESVGNNDPTKLHWLLRDLPSGWRPTSVFDTATSPPHQIPDVFAMNLYATEAAPLGPMLSVQGSTDTTQAIDIGSYSGDALSYAEFDLGGKRAAFATLPNGGRGLYVEINSSWVYLASRNISDELLIELAATLAPDATGHFDVAASALPAGFEKVVPMSATRRDLVTIDYSSPASAAGIVLLAVSPAAPALVGVPQMSFDFQPVSVGDFSGFVGSLTSENTTPPTTAWVVLWRRNGLDFEVTGQGLTEDQTIAAAASASRASPDEWAALGSQAGPVDTVSAGTSPAELPSDTQPGFVGEPRDVAVTVKVDDISSNEEQWFGVLPTGESWSAKISRVYDRMDVRYVVDGNVAGGIFGMSTAAVPGNQVTCCNPIAITKDPKAASLRVLRTNGDRYTIPLHEMPGTGGVHIALIAIPDGTLLAELIDASGNVLESYAPH